MLKTKYTWIQPHDEMKERRTGKKSEVTKLKTNFQLRKPDERQIDKKPSKQDKKTNEIRKYSNTNRQ